LSVGILCLALSICFGWGEPGNPSIDLSTVAGKVALSNKGQLAFQSSGLTEEGKLYYNNLVGYWDCMQTNRSETLGRPLESFPTYLQPVHETCQFYFGRRTNYEGYDLQKLLSPPWPFRLDATNFTEPEWDYLQKRSIRMRIEWFKLLNTLQPSDFLQTNRYSLKALY